MTCQLYTPWEIKQKEFLKEPVFQVSTVLNFF